MTKSSLVKCVIHYTLTTDVNSGQDLTETVLMTWDDADKVRCALESHDMCKLPFSFKDYMCRKVGLWYGLSGIDINVPGSFSGIPICADESGAVNTAETHEAPAEDDMVNHPQHYTQGKIECIDALGEAVTGLTGIEAVCTANAIKYLWRWKHKNGVEDLKKAVWYITHLIEELDGHE